MPGRAGMRYYRMLWRASNRKSRQFGEQFNSAV